MSSHPTVEILSISVDDARGIAIEPQRTLDTSSKPIALDGDLIALCDHDSETLIVDWKTEEQALLKSPDTWQVSNEMIVLATIAQSRAGQTAARRFY